MLGRIVSIFTVFSILLSSSFSYALPSLAVTMEKINTDPSHYENQRLVLESLILASSTDGQAGQKIRGNLSQGYQLYTKEEVERYYINVMESSTNVDVLHIKHPFALASYPDSFLRYLGDMTEELYDIVYNQAPIFYVYVNDQGELVLRDALNDTDGFIVKGDWPEGDYKFSGKLKAVNGTETERIVIKLNVAREIDEPDNQAPIAREDAYKLDENSYLVVSPESILDNDHDPDNGPNRLSVKVITWVNHGTLIMGTSGSFRYVPEIDFEGIDFFTYRAFDGEDYSNTVRVELTVGTIVDNQAPIAELDEYAVVSGDELDVDHLLGVLANDHDPDQGPDDLTAHLFELGHQNLLHGTLIFNDDGSFVYNPDKDYVGSAYFRYQAFDGEDYSNIAVVKIIVKEIDEPDNQAPIAEVDEYAIISGGELNVDHLSGVLANDHDPDQGPDDLTARLFELGHQDLLHGTLIFNDDGSFVYNPDKDYVGSAYFRYQAFDGEDYSNIAVVKIIVKESVGPDNKAPIAEGDEYELDKNGYLIIAPESILDNDYDPDNGPNRLSVEVITWVNHGTLIMDASGSFRYVPEIDFEGIDFFTYQAFDGEDYSNTVRVELTVGTIVDNQAPISNSDAYNTNVNVQLNISADNGVLVNDSDPDNGPNDLIGVLESEISHGQLTFNDDGSFVYNPESGFIGDDTFTYRAFDGEDYSNITTVTIVVAAVSGGGGGGGGTSRAPRNAQVLINNGAVSANNSTVVLSLSANNMTNSYAPLRMRINNINNFINIDWQDYATSTSWDLLTGNGTRTVYAQFKNRRGTGHITSDSINVTVGQVLGVQEFGDAGFLLAKERVEGATVYYVVIMVKNMLSLILKLITLGMIILIK